MQTQDYEVSLTGLTMGTDYHIKYVWKATETLPPPKHIKSDIDALLAEINQQMSVFLPESEISRFNRAPADTNISISADFAEVVAEAIRLHSITDGGLDISIGALVNLWGFGPNKHQQAAQNEQLSANLAHCGMEKLHLRQGKNCTLRKSDSQLYLNLSSIAKGFGVDKVAQYLSNSHINDYMVEIGGEIRLKGHNVIGKRWNIAIEQADAQGYQMIILLTDIALATSGDYKKYYQGAAGESFAHTINPHTGQALRHHLASLSVLADNAMTADGLATGLFVQGEEKAWEIAQRENIAVMMIIRQADGSFKQRINKAFAAYICESTHIT